MKKAQLSPEPAYAGGRSSGIGGTVMAEKVSIVHDFDCSEETFWDVFLDNDYNRRMFLEHMKFARWDIIEFEQSEHTVRRVVQVEPNTGPLPGPVKKAIGERISYQEQGVLDRTKNRYELRVIPPSLQDKMTISGAQWTQPLGEGRCRRTFEANVQVKIFGIGSLIEKRIAADMAKGYEDGADFTRSFIASRG